MIINLLFCFFSIPVIYTIEFQKRGLPHAHILVFLNPKYRCVKPEHIDRIISTEIPDKDTDPELFKIVTSLMIHGPCGPENESSPCMDRNKCTKHFQRSTKTKHLLIQMDIQYTKEGKMEYLLKKVHVLQIIVMSLFKI